MKMPHVISLSVLAGISAFVISLTGVAAENWPDSVDQYIEQVRKTIDTTDMDGSKIRMVRSCSTCARKAR